MPRPALQVSVEAGADVAAKPITSIEDHDVAISTLTYDCTPGEVPIEVALAP